MNWMEYHTESERFAMEAELALRAHDTKSSRSLYSLAAEAEERALASVDASKPRTRGITAVSAVALWFKAADYVRAEQLACSTLAGAQLPEFAREDLRTLVQAIWTESSKQNAGVTFVPGQVLVSVKGGEVVTGGAPLDLIVDKVQTIQALFYRTIEFINGVAHRRIGRPTRELQDSCRPWLFQSPPGSYQFSVAIQKPAQPDFFKQGVAPERVAQHFLEIVSASASGGSAELERIVPDRSYRSTFLKLARNLAPTGKTFDRIELRMSGDVRPVALVPESRANINLQLRDKSPQADIEHGTPIELRGTLRAVHLDKDWLEIAVDGEPTRVQALQDAVDDVIGPMVNRPVIVRAVRLSAKKLTFVDIELAD